MSHHEEHRAHRVGWLRAAVLGANDGIVSTASLIIGVAAASATQENIIIAGVDGLVAGAMSMYLFCHKFKVVLMFFYGTKMIF